MTIAWIRLGLLAVGFVYLTAMALADDKKPEIKEGKPAPEVALPATMMNKDKGGVLNLNSLRGKKHVVLFFYPKAMTPGCTIESCGFRDMVDDFAKQDTLIVGISTDTLEDQQKFMDKEKLTFPLMADADKIVAKTFNVLNGKYPSRHTFVIDKEGVIRKIYTTVEPGKHPKEVLEFVKTLQEKK